MVRDRGQRPRTGWHSIYLTGKTYLEMMKHQGELS